jgi:hypothetical protein
VGSLKDHKFVNYAMSGEQVQALPEKVADNGFWYLEEVYVDDVMALAIALSKEQ